MPTVTTSRQLSSPDGLLTFRLALADGVVHVTRDHHTGKEANGRFQVQFMVSGATELARVCAADDQRFAYPLLFIQLRQAFDELTAH